MMRMRRIHSFNFIYNITVLIIFIMLHFIFLVLTYLIIEIYIFWLPSSSSPLLPNPSLVATNLVSFPKGLFFTYQFSSVQLLSCVRLFETPWTAVHQASLSITNSWSLLKLMSIESVMPSNHLILCCPLLLLPSVFPSIRVFADKSSPLHQVAKILELQLQQ